MSLAGALKAEPPPGRCEDIVLAACKAPRAKWIVAFTATASTD